MKYSPAKLRKLAESNQLEVEDIVEAAFARDGSMAIELESMSIDFNWSEGNIIDGHHYVPYARWTRFACTFIRDGYAGLVAAYHGEDDFSLAFLQSYKTKESIDSVLEIAIKLGSSASAKTKDDIATAINLLLSFKGGPTVGDQKITELRKLLHSYHSQDLREAEKAVIYCALRGVGDQSSIDLINSQGKLTDPWAGLESQVIKTIKKRLSENA